MKIFYSIAITSFLLLIAVVLPNQAYAVVCQNKTAIVYSNGMFNEKKEADDSLVVLELRVRSFPQASNFLADIEFHLAYANDNGGFSAGFGTVLEQLLEVGRQALGDTNMDLFWEQLQGIVPADPQLLALMKELALVMGETAFVNDTDFNSMMNGSNDFEGYSTFLSSGKRVLIVSHSQGNYYSNRVYREITDPAYGGNAALASSIGVVAVATPASTSPGGKLGLNEPNITVPEDFVIAGVRAAFGSLPSKSDRIASNIFPINPFGWSSNVPELGFSSLITQFEQTTLGHNFVGWYLAGPYTRNFIMNGIVDTINGVNGFGRLRYSGQCTKWPPVPTPTSWQSVLTHEWSTKYNRAFGLYKRVMRDDANELVFDSSYSQVGSYPVTAQMTISVSDFFGRQLGGVSYTYNLNIFGVPQTTSTYRTFLGFVPIPRGVGALFHRSKEVIRVPQEYLNNVTSNDSIDLVKFVYNPNSNLIEQTATSLPLPTYPVYYYGVWRQGLLTSPTSAYKSSYSRLIVQSGINKSWIILPSHGIWAEGAVENHVYYTKVTINDGMLAASSPSYIGGGLWSNLSCSFPPTRTVDVSGVAGTFSSVLSAVAQTPWSFIAWLDPYPPSSSCSVLLQPSPVVPAAALELFDSGILFDQKIVGGSDVPAYGSSVSSAPDYFEHAVFVASYGGKLMNSSGVEHPAMVQYSIYEPDALTFFQW